ncbi:hypothetical protein GAY28_15840 [Azospirillum brasilense]|nr:hypothetical protein [Azospirillum brasilense]
MTTADLSAHLTAVVAAIRSRRLPLGHEKETQAAISDALTAAGIEHVRERRIGARDILDHFTVGGVAVEVKLRGGKRDIHRQLCRYAEHEEVKALVLASSVAMGLPPSINGKPLVAISLGSAWL